MAETRTGLNPWLSESGTSYLHELTRQATRIASEMVEQATAGIPRQVDIVRSTIDAAANSALGISANTTKHVATVQATYFQKTSWMEERPSFDVEIRKADRALILADVPALGGQLSDKIFMTDVIEVDDPEFGLIELQITKITPLRGSGLIHIEAVYQR